MEYIEKDITTVSRGVIAHVVNNRDAMGAGVARAIYIKWPEVKSAYHKGLLRLGITQVVPIVENKLYVLNLCAQDGYGNDGRKYLVDYALVACMQTAISFSNRYELPLYIPYKMGCGLAGGSWDDIAETLYCLSFGCEQAFYICKP